MPRVALVLAYQGAAYQGWQSQVHGQTVQDHLESALSKLVGEKLSVVCAGRTDAGVNATHQVVHFDAPVLRSDTAFTRGLNSHLPDDIAVQHQLPVDHHFQARFQAQRRRYHYLIYRSPYRHPRWHQRATWVFQPLDVDAMRTASMALLGEHDFTSFRSAECQAKTPVRRVHTLRLWEKGPHLVLSVEANGFLHHMVRNLVGALLQVGMGKQDVPWVAQLLALKDRTQGAATAPAAGLYFTGVHYGDTHPLTTLSWPVQSKVDALLGV
jgi:tRNA pseudouridine38-40 synthase